MALDWFLAFLRNPINAKSGIIPLINNPKGINHDPLIWSSFYLINIACTAYLANTSGYIPFYMFLSVTSNFLPYSAPNAFLDIFVFTYPGIIFVIPIPYGWN